MSNYTFHGKKFNVDADNINVTGVTVLNGNTTVNGNTVVNGTLTAADTTLNNTTINGTLSVTGSTTLAGTTINGVLDVDNIVGTNIDINSTGDLTLESTGTLSFPGTTLTNSSSSLIASDAYQQPTFTAVGWSVNPNYAIIQYFRLGDFVHIEIGMDGGTLNTGTNTIEFALPIPTVAPVGALGAITPLVDATYNVDGSLRSEIASAANVLLTYEAKAGTTKDAGVYTNAFIYSI